MIKNIEYFVVIKEHLHYNNILIRITRTIFFNFKFRPIFILLQEINKTLFVFFLHAGKQSKNVDLKLIFIFDY